jgi:hypothetical protein
MRALNRTEPDAIKIGGNALLNLGCGISSNSRDKNAIRIFGSAQVTADPLTAVDGINLGATNLVGNSTKRPYLVEQPDPLANVTASIPLQVARQVRIQ